MRKIIPIVLFAFTILLGKAVISAQTTATKENSCQPSAEEILSVIKSIYKWSPPAKGVSIAGEIQGGYGELRIPKEQLSLTQVLAMVGGVIGSKPSHLVYLVRQSSGNKTTISLEFDLREIKQGQVKDVKLDKGDVIFVPRGCEGGKLLTPTKPELPRGMPRNNDYVKPKPNKRITK